jgi:hypothetical protein
MTLSTQLSLVREVKWSINRPLKPLMIGASKVLSEGFWEGTLGENGWPHKPLWARIVWRFRRFVPAFLWAD